MELLHYLDPQEIIRMAGPLALVVLFGIVFAESGLFFGFFLPGDSLLFIAGVAASQGFFSLPVLIVALAIAAILGDSVGYWFGNKVGRRFFQREDSFWFHRRNLEKAHDFYETHGGKAIILARFLPIVRTFVPIVAGIGAMTYSKFLSFNVIGGIGWVVLMTVGGYVFGSLLPAKDVEKYIVLVVLMIIVISVLPTAWHLYRENRNLVHAFVRARVGRSNAAD
ncbi:MAG: VTT domain-containing protein [Chloroflexi bacterium]|nr:VTT domain-containing protein [Chloroflexota bacterium]